MEPVSKCDAEIVYFSVVSSITMNIFIFKHICKLLSGLGVLNLFCVVSLFRVCWKPMEV